MNRGLAMLVAALAIGGCSPAPEQTVSPTESLASAIALDCGPIADRALCEKAVEVAATAKLNPPPIVSATIRRPDSGDECTTWFHACGPEAVIVEIQSGDTIQSVPLIRSATNGWIRLDLVR